MFNYNYIPIILIYFFNINNLEQCFNTNGVQQIPKNQPCECNSESCSQICNIQEGGCVEEITNIFNQTIQVKGNFTFQQLIINQSLTNSARILNPDFSTFREIGDVRPILLDNKDGTYYTKQNSSSTSQIELRNWEDNSVIRKATFSNIDFHELRQGINKQEIICISGKQLDLSDEIPIEPIVPLPYDPNDPGSGKIKSIQKGNGITIIDFTADPPTSKEIDLTADFEPKHDWGTFSNNFDWMHGNSAGVDQDGNQYLNGFHGSFFVVQDRETLKRKQTISTEFRTDQTFADLKDKFYGAHDVHQLDNGNWLFQDNNVAKPENEGLAESRCIEYQFDHESKTVHKVWEQAIPNVCLQTGSCRRMPNGNTIIGFTNCLPQEHYDLDYKNVENYPYYWNQVIEADANGYEVAKATLYWSFSQLIYRAVPSFSYIPFYDSDVKQFKYYAVEEKDKEVIEIRKEYFNISKFQKHYFYVIVFVVILLNIGFCLIAIRFIQYSFYPKEYDEFNYETEEFKYEEL